MKKLYDLIKTEKKNPKAMLLYLFQGRE